MGLQLQCGKILWGRRIGFLLCFFLMVAFWFVPAARGENSQPPNIIRDVKDADDIKLTHLVIPYAFYSESFELAIGIAGGATGFQSGQMGLYGTALTTTNGTTALYFMGTDIQVPIGNRLFFDSFLSVGWFAEQRDYVSGNPDFPNEQAGSNDSSADNFIVDSGWDNWAEFRFKYILPIGHARDSAINTNILDRGILVSGATGGDIWNPTRSGITFLQIKPFYRMRTFDFESEDISGSGDTNGAEFGLVYDNRDFSPNPSKGSVQRVSLARDFGWFDSTNSWTVVKGKFSKYVSLGESKKFRQRVIALNLWAADTPGQEEELTPSGVEITNRAPPYMGASLGGFYRLRAYPQYRFHDKAAIYYGAEFRVIPEWNPFEEVKWLKFLDIDWWQLVGILEAGRVSSTWNLDTLYKDLHWDAGIGLRLMARKVVVRLDTVFSNEGWNMWVMAGQPF